MRVIGGYHRSRLLEEVPSESTRETKDRVKETIFNSIQFDLPEATILDLFSGSGSLGIEALSRGAKHCDFNDASKLAYDVTMRNLQALDLTSQATCTQYEALTCLTKTSKSYDIILLDPPYELDILSDCINVIETNKILNPHGIIVALHRKNDVISLKDCAIIEYKTKTSGITKISYLKWGESQ